MIFHFLNSDPCSEAINFNDSSLVCFLALFLIVYLGKHTQVQGPENLPFYSKSFTVFTLIFWSFIHLQLSLFIIKLLSTFTVMKLHLTVKESSNQPRSLKVSVQILFVYH